MMIWFVRHLLHSEADITGKSCPVNDSQNQFSLGQYSPGGIYLNVIPKGVIPAQAGILQIPRDIRAHR